MRSPICPLGAHHCQPLKIMLSQRPLGPAGLLALPGHAPLALKQSRKVGPARRRAPCQPGSSRRVRPVAASSEPLLRSDSASVALPLDYYRLLGVSGVCSRDSLARALEK